VKHPTPQERASAEARRIVHTKQNEIDQLAGCVFRLPHSVSGDLQRLSMAISRTVQEHLELIAKRTATQEED